MFDFQCGSVYISNCYLIVGLPLEALESQKSCYS